MRLDDQRRSSNVEDRRGGGFGLPVIGGGIGTIVIVIIAALFGINPGKILNQGGSQPAQQAPTSTAATNDPQVDFVAAVLGDTEDVWSAYFKEHGGQQYQEPHLVLFSGVVQSACGMAQSATGPFYCPLDGKVYIDASFFSELQSKFGADGGQLAKEYVVAHEYGHHIQDILGLLGRAQQDPQGPESGSVRLELMADCLAGMWVKNATQTKDANGVTYLKPITQEDIASALSAASAVGDDRIQKATQGRVNPESWTHGSSAQRQKWFTTGYQTGDLNQCNTFATQSL